MEKSLPLHICHVQKSTTIINRSHAFLHSIALLALIYYRASYFFRDTKTKDIPILLWLMVFGSELLLSFQWLLNQAYRWRPVSRTVFPERLPEDKELPGIDVFICTADPNKEPTLGVMNTVISAMALDYPPEKLYVYLSDDGGSPVTLQGMREAWRFARWWLPFCRTYGIKTRCPGAYFSALEDENYDSYLDTKFIAERLKIKGKYELFKEQVMKAREMGRIGDKSISTCQDHPPVVEVIHDNSTDALGVDQAEMPLLVYVSREKRPSHAHHFKAGALNVLLRVSGIISNSSYILVLDCDMYCNDPSSARQAMCFHLDPKISATLAFVQFPKKFHNLSKNDIYDGRLRSAFAVSTSWFMIYSFLFLSSIFKQVEEVLSTGGSIQTWWNEQRIWMIKSVTAYFYGTLDAILKLFGMREARFIPTNKVDDDEQIKLYQRGTFDFRTSTALLAPLVTFVILNLASFIGGISRAIIAGGMEELFGQIFLSFFFLIVNYPIINGMIVRKDRGRVPPSVTLLCVVISMIFLALGSIVLMF
ncbi:hypothetical protein L1049_016854 [Liquidambar formosana]|uniref:Cellulose synthase-like protein G2 n=1 Tax=Liquidambar formosana TaxID=63359 RepID=A0AAP0X733_LIQFO